MSISFRTSASLLFPYLIQPVIDGTFLTRTPVSALSVCVYRIFDKNSFPSAACHRRQITPAESDVTV